MSAPIHLSKRRGWLIFIGQGAQKQAVLSNGEAFDKITRQSNYLVGVVNMLGSATKRWQILTYYALPIYRDMVSIVQNSFDEVGLFISAPPADGSARRGYADSPLQTPSPKPELYNPVEDELPDLRMHDCCVCYERIYELLPCTHPVCTNRQRHLRDPRCPMCRADLTTGAAQEPEPVGAPCSEWWVCLGCGAQMCDSYTPRTNHCRHCS